MAKFRSIRNSFLGGEVSPTAEGRTDLPQYPHACKLLRNMIPLLSGGAYRRPGSLHMDTLPITTDYAPRIFEFIVNKNESYAILVGKTVGGSDYAKYYRATTNATGGLSSGNVTGTPPWTFATAGGLTTVGFDDEIRDVQTAQSADVMWMVHPNQKPQLLKRTAANTFTIGAFDAGLATTALRDIYPYINQNTTSISLTASATSGAGITLTASAALFVSTQVGTIYKIFDGGSTYGAVIVTGYTSSTVVTVTSIVDLGDTGGHTTWWESAWSPTRGWPRSVALYQNRLVMGGNSHQPDTLWFSKTGNYSVFSTMGMVVDDSLGNGSTTGPLSGSNFRVTLASNQVNLIQWISPDKQLAVGTLLEEWLMGTNTDGSFDITSPAVLQSKYGSDYLQPSRIGYELVIPMGTQDEIRAYQYNYIDASFFAEPIQNYFDHYPKAETGIYATGRKKFRRFVWDESRKTVWCIDTAGNLFGMTRDRKLGATAWHSHQMGGFDSTKGTDSHIGATTAKTVDPSYAMCDGSVVSIACIPNPISGVNDIWLVVKRTINSVVNWQVERIIGKNINADSAYTLIAPGTSATDPYLVDSAFWADDNGSATSKTYAPGAYLEGKSLVGTYYSSTKGIFKISTGAVSSGNATITSSVPSDYGTLANTVTLGLAFTPQIELLRIESGSVIGTAQGAIKRINRAFVRFYKTIFGQIGMVQSTEETGGYEEILFRDWTSPIGKSPELFTGDKKVLIPSTYERDGYLHIEQAEPMPFTVVGVVSEGEEFD